MCGRSLDARFETPLLTKRRAVDLCRVATCLCHAS
ncbi:MAG: Ms5788A family Cys-rich leader peptide [Actinomycetes bacterium]